MKVQEDIDLIKRELAQVDIINDDKKLLEWAKLVYPTSGQANGVKDMKRTIDKLERIKRGNVLR